MKFEIFKSEILGAVFMLNKLVSLFASLMHAKHCLIVQVNGSTRPSARWSFAGTGIRFILFFVQTFST